MCFNLAQRAADPACAYAVVDVAFLYCTTNVGEHAHAFRFPSELDFEFVASQEPSGVGFEVVLATKIAAESIGCDVEMFL